MWVELEHLPPQVEMIPAEGTAQLAMLSELVNAEKGLQVQGHWISPVNAQESSNNAKKNSH